MKNKQVKQMMCDVYFAKYGSKYEITHGRGFGLLWRAAFPVGDFFVVNEPNGAATPILHFRPISLTSNQLRGK